MQLDLNLKLARIISNSELNEIYDLFLMNIHNMTLSISEKMISDGHDSSKYLLNKINESIDFDIKHYSDGVIDSGIISEFDVSLLQLMSQVKNDINEYASNPLKYMELSKICIEIHKEGLGHLCLTRFIIISMCEVYMKIFKFINE